MLGFDLYRGKYLYHSRILHLDQRWNNNAVQPIFNACGQRMLHFPPMASQCRHFHDTHLRIRQLWERYLNQSTRICGLPLIPRPQHTTSLKTVPCRFCRLSATHKGAPCGKGRPAFPRHSPNTACRPTAAWGRGLRCVIVVFAFSVCRGGHRFSAYRGCSPWRVRLWLLLVRGLLFAVCGGIFGVCGGFFGGWGGFLFGAFPCGGGAFFVSLFLVLVLSRGCFVFAIGRGLLCRLGLVLRVRLVCARRFARSGFPLAPSVGAGRGSVSALCLLAVRPFRFVVVRRLVCGGSLCGIPGRGCWLRGCGRSWRSALAVSLIFFNIPPVVAARVRHRPARL